MKYATTKNDGSIIGFYDDRVHDPLPSEAVELTDEQYQQWANDPAGFKLVDGNLVSIPKPEPDYRTKRAADYPSTGEQLDMIYHDQLNGTTIWQDTLRAVKDKYPKPE